MIDGFSDRRKDPAYRNGWGDGRFGLMETVLENPNLARWESHLERFGFSRTVSISPKRPSSQPFL